MTDTKTSAETTRSPIDGTELVRLATPSANWKTTIAALLAFGVGGSNGQVLFNSSGAEAGSQRLTWDGTAFNIGHSSDATGVLKLVGTTSGAVSLSAQDAAGSWTMKLPTTAGTAGFSLTTDGSGNTTWTNVSAGGSPGGSSKQFQYNNSGSLAGANVWRTGADETDFSDSTTAQQVRIYKTTDNDGGAPTNAEWCTLDWTTTVPRCTIGTKASGTGVARTLALQGTNPQGMMQLLIGTDQSGGAFAGMDAIFPNGGIFRTLTAGIYSAADIFFQAFPANTNNYFALDATFSAGLVLSTSNGTPPIWIAPGGTEMARFDTGSGGPNGSIHFTLNYTAPHAGVGSLNGNVLFFQLSFFGTSDIFCQLLPIGPTGNAVFEGVNCANLLLSTGGSPSNSIIIQPNRVIAATFTAGQQLGSPTGGDKGAGTLNVATNIFLNGTAYTNPKWVMKRHWTGENDEEGTYAPPRPYDGLMSIEDTEEFTRLHHDLPLMQMLGGKQGLFDGGDLVLASLEEAYLYIFELNRRLKALEARYHGGCS